MNVRLESAKDKEEHPIFYFNWQGRSYYTSSRYSSSQESKKFLESLPTKSLYICLGISNFELIKQVLEKYPKANFVFLACEELENFNLARCLEEYCQKKLIFHFVKQGSSAGFQNLGEYYHPFQIEALGIIYTPAYQMYQKVLNFKHQNYLEAYIQSIQNNFVTQARFGLQWHTNTLWNISELVSRVQKKQFLESGKTWLILGAGPGLFSERERIKKILENPDIHLACADTAYRYVLRYLGKMPDLVMTLDPQSISIKHFLGLEKPKLHLADAGVNASLFRTLSSLAVPSSHPLHQYLFGQKYAEASLRGSAANVGHALVQRVLQYAPKKIFLGGLDFAVIDSLNYSKACEIHLELLYKETRTYKTDIFSPLVKEAGEHKNWYRTDLLNRYYQDFLDTIELPSSSEMQVINAYADLFPKDFPKSFSKVSAPEDTKDYFPCYDKELPEALMHFMDESFRLEELYKKPAKDTLLELLSEGQTPFSLALRPLIFSFFRNNLKKGFNLTDSKTKACTEAFEYNLGLCKKLTKEFNS